MFEWAGVNIVLICTRKAYTILFTHVGLALETYLTATLRAHPNQDQNPTGNGLPSLLPHI